MNMKELVDFLNYHTKLYNENIAEISDYEWDKAYFELKKMESETGIILPNSPTQKINYEVVTELKKVEHNHFMGSLDKTKDMNQFINYFTSGKDVIGMLKLDGLTVSLKYMNGELVSAETRGNGSIGEDIMYNARVIPSIPKYINYKEELVLDGEIICTYEDFKPFSKEYANSRNFASGSIRLLDSKECSKRNLTFIVWNVVKGLYGNSFLNKLRQVEKEGFKIVPWTSSLDWDWAEFLQNEAKELGYPIDGLVGRYDDIAYGESLGATDHHIRAAYAFKFYDEEHKTTLKDIEWTMGRTSVLTPVAVFEPVDDGVSVIERATLHNISVMEELFHNHLGWVGQEINVAKMNQIIPQIMSTEEWVKEFDYNYIEYPKVCPACGGSVKVMTSNSGVKNLVCENPQCSGLLINRIDHFCGKKGLDVKGLSKATIEKLINKGWLNKRADIFKLQNYQKEWENLPGFGVKSVSNILTAIEGAKNTNFEKYLSSLGIPLIGRTVSKELSKVFSSYDEFRKAIREGYDFSQLEGFGYEMNKTLHNYDYTEADEIAAILSFKQQDISSFEEVTKSLDGQVFVITGKVYMFKNRDELKSKIESLGGKVSSTVSAKTNYLINNDSTSETAKNKKAKELGIEILTEENFMKKFDLL